MKKNPKAAPFRKKGWTHYCTIHTLLPMKPKGLNVFHPGQPTMQEENGGDDPPGGGVGDLSSDGAGEDMGHNNPCGSDEGEGEEPIPWVSQVVGSTSSISEVCQQEQTPPCEMPVQQSRARRSPSPISRGHKRKPSNLLSLATTRSSTPTIKKQCVSTGAALEGLGDRLSEFNETCWTNNEPQRGIESTPARKRIAICQAQELETDLEIEHVVALIHIFEGDVSAADAYVVLKREELRKLWVRSKLGLV
jgi:hypothetical protein